MMERVGAEAKIDFKAHPHMLRHVACQRARVSWPLAASANPQAITTTTVATMQRRPEGKPKETDMERWRRLALEAEQRGECVVMRDPQIQPKMPKKRSWER